MQDLTPPSLRYWQDSSVAISREQVLHVAKLARLALSEEEVDRFSEQLNAILEAIGKVSELDLSDVPPTSHPLALVNVVDADEPRPSLALEQALSNAPESESGAFRVPASG
jgi:aspartyl-tRNA(Asn)/glutamyl-tRNA(Gln) amidotransferase subunit C